MTAEKQTAYSNCLFEAVRAKLRDMKHVHIFRVPKRYGGGATHFMWYNSETGTYYHSAGLSDVYEKCKSFWTRLRHIVWHEQRIKEIDEAFFNAFILKKLKVHDYTVAGVKKAARKMHLRILRINCEYTESNPNCEPVLPNADDVAFLRKVFRKEPVFKVVKFHSRTERELAVMTYDELAKCAVDDEMELYWKFIGIDDEEFTWLYAPACDYADVDMLNYGGEQQNAVQENAAESR